MKGCNSPSPTLYKCQIWCKILEIRPTNIKSEKLYPHTYHEMRSFDIFLRIVPSLAGDKTTPDFTIVVTSFQQLPLYADQLKQL